MEGPIAATFDLWLFFFFFHWVRVARYLEIKKKKKSCTVTGMGPPNSVKNSEWCKLSDCTKQPWYLEWWVMKIEWWVMSDGNWMIKKVNQTGPKCLFGWREFWVISSCFHNSWSKTGGAHGRSLFWTLWLMIRDLVSITQFSDFWVMSYGNWKHILAVFSFHNS